MDLRVTRSTYWLTINSPLLETVSRNRYFNLSGREPAEFTRALVNGLGELRFEGIDFLDSCVAHHQRRAIVGWRDPVSGHIIYTAKLS